MTSPKKIVVGGFDVLATGTVLSYGWQPIDIYPVDPTYHVRILFESQPNQPATITINQLPGSLTQIKAVNFDSSSGSSTSTPAHIAIPRSRHNPKILWVDDAEIVGDRIT